MTMITGSAIQEFRLIVLHKALKLELLGLRRSHSPSAYSILKRELNLKGSRQSVYDQVQKLLDNTN